MESLRPVKPPLRLYRFGDKTIDAARREIRAGSGLVPLRKKAFDVLIYLIVNRDRAVTKQELFASVWERTAVSEDVLVGCIALIRKALGDNSAEPALVKTVHGVGYHFIGEVEEAGADDAEEETAEILRKGRRDWIRTLAPIMGAVFLLAIGLARWRAGPPQDEVAWWKFEESTPAVEDSAGGGNAGTLYGGVRRVPGKLGSALEFDGASGRVIGNGPGRNLPRGSAPRTITAWIRSPAPHVGDAGVFHYGTKGPTPPRANFHLHLSVDGRIGFGNGHGHGAIAGRRMVADDRWHHVAGRYDGPNTGSLVIFVDGEGDGGGPLPKQPETGSDTSWSIGCFQEGGVSFRGLIDDVRVFARALEHAEIQSLYRCGVGLQDLSLPVAGRAYYSNLQGSTVDIGREDRNASSASVLFEGRFGGVQFAIATPDCALSSLRGAALPNDLRVSVDLSPGPGQTQPSYAGVLIGARSAGPNEPATGALAPGVWARVSSAGEVSIVSLKEIRTSLAVSRPVAGFDSGAFHTLVVERRGPILRAWLNRAAVRFRIGAAQGESESVVMPEDARGGAAAGIAFEQNPQLYGTAPRARNVIVTALQGAASSGFVQSSKGRNRSSQ